MIENTLNIDEVNAAIKAIRSVNLKAIGKDDLRELINALSKHIAIVTNLEVGRVIIRSVSCNYLKDNPVSIYPLKVSQLSYNPNAASCGFNRASWQGETAFYGSVATDKIQPYYTSGFEVLSDLESSENDIDKEDFVVGKWTIKKQLPLVHLSGYLKHNDQVSLDRYNSLYDTISRHPESIISLKMIDSYLCEEFAKKVPKNEKWQFKVSAAYSGFIKNDGWAGMLYPSLQTDGAGYNIALFPNEVDKYLTFERAALMRYYKRGISITNEVLMEAFPDGDFLRWRDYYDGRLPPQMKRWYTGLSDDDSFEKSMSYEDL
jgi:hypothetical protein